MPDQSDYKNLINEIVAKQILILGPDIVLLKARNVPGLSISDEGVVQDLRGNPQDILQHLIDQYIALSGEIVRNILNPVFAKYPDIKIRT